MVACHRPSTAGQLGYGNGGGAACAYPRSTACLGPWDLTAPCQGMSVKPSVLLEAMCLNCEEAVTC